jgi:hypothetical protein
MTISVGTDHTIGCAVKSCLYLVIVMYVKFLCLSIAVMMLNVFGDRKVLPDDNRCGSRPYHWMRRQKLPIPCNSNACVIPMFKHSCNDVECFRG